MMTKIVWTVKRKEDNLLQRKKEDQIDLKIVLSFTGKG